MIVPVVHYYREQISSFYCTAYNILTNEISLILPKFHKIIKRKGRHYNITNFRFYRLAYEDISSFLHNRKHKALHKAVKVI